MYINQLLSNKSLPDPQIAFMSQGFNTEHSATYGSGHTLQSSQKAFMLVTSQAGVFHEGQGHRHGDGYFYTGKFLQTRKLISVFNPFLFAESHRCLSNSTATILHSALQPIRS